MPATIVCGVDPADEHAGLALTVAADLARRLGDRLVLVHVAPIDAAGFGYAEGGGFIAAPAPAVPYPPSLPAEGPEHDRLRDEARERVGRLAGQFGIEEPVVHVESDPNVPATIRRVAADLEAELIVVGSHGRGALRAALLGSTSHALAAQAPCAVLVVPPPAS